MLGFTQIKAWTPLQNVGQIQQFTYNACELQPCILLLPFTTSLESYLPGTFFLSLEKNLLPRDITQSRSLNTPVPECLVTHQGSAKISKPYMSLL